MKFSHQTLYKTEGNWGDYIGLLNHQEYSLFGG